MRLHTEVHNRLGGGLKRLRIRVDGAICEATLFEDAAPRTVAALWRTLPIKEHTIQTRWSGDAWRTRGNYELLPADAPIENVAGRLSAGDIIYWPGYESRLVKIGVAYGDAQWLGPFMVPLRVALVGKIDRGLDEFVRRCERIIFERPLDVEMSQIEDFAPGTAASQGGTR